MGVPMPDLKKDIIKASENGRIKCSEALAIAKNLKVPTKKVGKAIDDLGIKIIDCQLGCFE
jgi:hypothetical protein